MIEREIISKRMKEIDIQNYIKINLATKYYGKIEVTKTPLGEKIIVHTTRPGLVVGRAGENISKLTKQLKDRFKMENPQIEVSEIESPFLDPQSVAERIVGSFERFGPKRFKSIGYRALQESMDAGAIGAEIVISGRGVPSSRSKSWRFSAGHLKKSGDIAENYLKRNISVAHLKSGSIGIKVGILTPDIQLPDDISFIESEEGTKEETEKETKESERNGEEKGTKPAKQSKSRKKTSRPKKTTDTD